MHAAVKTTVQKKKAGDTAGAEQAFQKVTTNSERIVALFGDLMNTVWSDYARMIFNVQVSVEAQNGGGGEAPAFAAAGSSTQPGRVSYSGGHSAAGVGGTNDSIASGT